MIIRLEDDYKPGTRAGLRQKSVYSALKLVVERLHNRQQGAIAFWHWGLTAGPASLHNDLLGPKA